LTEDEKKEFLKKYEKFLKEQDKKMEEAAKREREERAVSGFLRFKDRIERGIPPVDERTGFYGFANPDVLDVNLRKKIEDDVYLRGGVQFPQNGDPFYSAGITKTFNKGGRVGYKNGGLVFDPNDYIEHYSDGTKLYKIKSFIKDIAKAIS